MFCLNLSPRIARWSCRSKALIRENLEKLKRFYRHCTSHYRYSRRIARPSVASRCSLPGIQEAGRAPENSCMLDFSLLGRGESNKEERKNSLLLFLEGEKLSGDHLIRI